ncbi:hypothetical protein HII17_17230 [Thalassotalea sp. M1531]|uniref:TolC family protein n=1 Tax=Thalassotalea algicola TaxID=2716224 RepID=A0A7Y0LFK5_9GAMM|nr:hypothetical protein [Thalassotalea algicola]NMP33299.1 hypothetical protein [Thalassotalea algicola]
MTKLTIAIIASTLAFSGQLAAKETISVEKATTVQTEQLVNMASRYLTKNQLTTTTLNFETSNKLTAARTLEADSKHLMVAEVLTFNNAFEAE